MFLRTLTCALVLWGCAASAQTLSAPEHQWTDNVVGSHILQVGVDAWDIRTSASEDTKANMNSLSLLQLANSYPQWDYHSTAPWVRFEGGLRIGSDVLLNMKYRADQSTASRVDEASVDWVFHTYGVKLGVLDPKISWCRTYDVDSPWARETNPYCTIKPLVFARGSAPGVQTYGNFIAGDYSLQAIAGTYRPLMFGYESRATPTITVASSATVTERVKTGVALSATNLRSGTEFRLSLMRDAYSVYRPILGTSPARKTDFSADVLFVGAAWQITPKVAVRGSYFTYAGDLYYNEFDRIEYVSLYDQKLDSSKTVEINFQANSKNIYSIGSTVSSLNLDQYLYELNGNSVVSKSANKGAPTYTTTNVAVSWRRDWSGGLFTVLQLSDARVKQSDSSKAIRLSSNGQAIGLRLGYRF
jgi:hypothetical protein